MHLFGIRYAYTESMTTTHNIEIYNTRSGKAVRSFTSRKQATIICRLYNDLSKATSFNTRIQQAVK